MNKEMGDYMKKAILVGIDNKDDLYDIDYSLNELSTLAGEIGITTALKITQKGSINKYTYVGSGKLSEILVEVKMLEADVVIFNDELSPLMYKNIQEILQLEILDRSSIILEIFLNHAHTTSSKLEIKLANLKYLYPRLSSIREGFDRQRAGDKGSGETQLELDRRKTLNDINRIEKALEEEHRMKSRVIQRRKKDGIKTVALVGYTNAGKSSTLNSIIEYTNKDIDKMVYAKNQLFATLDTSVRRIDYNQTSFLLTDTIGFVSKLPHHLVNSFKETLMEVAEADLIIHVLDASSKYAYMEFQTTMQVLQDLDVSDKKMLILLNKIDLCEQKPSVNGIDSIEFSAKTKHNIDKLLKYITNYLNSDMINTTVLIPYSDGKMLNYVRNNAKIISQVSLDSGYQITLTCDKRYYSKISLYEPNDSKYES